MVTPPLLEPPPAAEPLPSLREVMPLEQAERAGTEAAARRPPRRVRRFIEGSLGSAVAEEEALEAAQQQVEEYGDHGDQHRAAEHLHEVALGEAVEDVPAEAPEGDVRG